MTTQTTTKTTTITRRSRLQIDWQWRTRWQPVTASDLATRPLMSPAQVLYNPAWALGTAVVTVYHRGQQLAHSDGEQGLWMALAALLNGLIAEFEWPIAQDTDED